MPEICAILDSPRTPRHALYVQPSHGSPFPVPVPPYLPELSPTRYTICLGRTFVCRCCSTALSVHPQLMLAPLVLSAWQKLFKILLLGATSKCQVFTITLPTPLPPSLLLLLTLLLLLLVQFYLILMGFFLPPTAECIKQSQAHGSITHECVPQAPAVCA